MKLLVFGRTGQVARELDLARPPGIEIAFLGRAEVDLGTPAACAGAIAAMPADAVINAAAFTAVDLAESQEELAHRVNAAAPGAMAQACAARGIPLLHLSTDYVFGGAGSRPFAPDDRPAPINAYGRSKLAGEHAVRASGARHLILRTSWVFSSHGRNFLTTIVKLARERNCLRVVNDQTGGPTPAAAIARALLAAVRQLADGHSGGTYHFAGAPDVSWAGFAREIAAAAGLGCRIEDIASEAYTAAARRPANSRLDCTGFETDFGISRPSWRKALYDIIPQLETRA